MARGEAIGGSRGASIGDRLALDDSAIDGHTQTGNIGKRWKYRNEQVATPNRRYR